MALRKSTLGPSILLLVKGEVEEIKANTLNNFAVVDNSANGDTMVAFTVKETPDKYYWASTTLKNFLLDNTDLAEEFDDTGVHHFPDDTVVITHEGKTPLKSDKSKSANVWKVDVN